MAEREKRRSTTFVTSRGAIINVAAPSVYIAPGVTPADVTSPAELRVELREALREQLTRKAFLGYNNTRYGWVYDCKYNPFDDEYYVSGHQSKRLFRIKPREGWSVEEITTPNVNEMLTIDSEGKVWYTPTYVNISLGALNPQVQKYDPDTGLISVYDLSAYPTFLYGAGIEYDARRDKVLVLGNQLLVELNMNGTVNRTLATSVSSLEGVLIWRDLAYMTTVGGELVIVDLTTFTEVGATVIATSLGAPYTVTLLGEKFSWHYYQSMPMLVMYARLNVSTIPVEAMIIILLAADGKSVRAAAVVSNGYSYMQRLPENLVAVGCGILNYMTGDFMSTPYVSVDWDGENIIGIHSGGPISPYPNYFNVQKPNLTGKFRTEIPLWSNYTVPNAGAYSPPIWTHWCETVTFNLNSVQAGAATIQYWDEQANVWRTYDSAIAFAAGTPLIYVAGGGKKLMRIFVDPVADSACDLQVHLR